MNKEVNTKSSVFISGFESYLEDVKDISNIKFLKNDSKKLETYYKMGMKTYIESQVPMAEMAYYSVKKTLESVKIAPDEIDVFLYVCENHIVKEKINSTMANTLMNYLGMTNAYAIGISLSDCANILMGLQIAQSLIQTGQANNIILVSTNKVPESEYSRSMKPEVAVSSDAAVSVLVSKDKGDYKLLGTSRVKNEPTPNDAPPLDLSIKKIKGLRIAIKQLFSQIDLSQEEIDRVYVSNYADLSEIFVESCGFDSDKGFYSNFAKYAHCMAGDVLITLQEQDEFIKPEEKILMISDGPFGSFATCVQKC